MSRTLLTLWVSVAALSLGLLACDSGNNPEITPEPTPVPQRSSMRVLSAKVGDGDTFGTIAQSHGISWENQQALVEASKEELDLARHLRPGDSVVMQFKGSQPDSELLRMTVQRRSDRRVVFERDPDGKWLAELDEPEFEVREVLIDGSIEGSLWNSLAAEGLDAGIIGDLIHVFEWQVDFFALQPGDRFRAVLQAKYLDGSFRGHGSILGGRFQRGKKEAFVIRFTPPEGKAGFYDLEGGSNKRMFLASALDYARISSHFTLRRYHPILHKWRSHRGTDYAAGSGTPVRTVGDGVVVYAGRKGGYGNHVRVRHKSPWESSYSHLSKIKVRKGQHLSQGDLVGKVGSTGLATGPHLHYEFYTRGKQVDWEKQDFPATEPLEKSVLPIFEPIKNAMVARLVDDQFPMETKEASEPAPER